MRIHHRLRPVHLFAAPVLASVLFAAPGRAQDTGFLRGQGKMDVVLTYSMDSYDEFWVGDMKVADPGVGEVERSSVNLYAAYGLQPNMDLFADIAYASSEHDGAAGAPDESDLQDLAVGVKWRFLSRQHGAHSWSLLAAPSVKVPVTDYEDNALTAIGDGEEDLRARVIAHWQWDRGIFASIETGYDIRNGPPDNEIPLNVTVGGTVFDRLTIAPFYSMTDSRGGIDLMDVPALGPFSAVEEDVERYGVNAYMRIDDTFGVTARYFSTNDGRNTGDADGVSIGVVYRR